MREHMKFYIDGEWVAAMGDAKLSVINPATEAVAGRIALGSGADVNLAVGAAKRAFASWSRSDRQQRVRVLQRIAAEYERRAGDLALAMTEEMGAPTSVSGGPQVDLGLVHLKSTVDVLLEFPFEEQRGRTVLRREGIGVCGLITPWNWPMNQIVCKVAPAIAAGCTVILKPSELAPFSAQIWAEIVHEAGTPAGVFNMIQGDGLGVGVALSTHPDVDLISFTGSTRAGVEVARNAAPSVKRVCQELGGKSPLIIFDDDRFADGVAFGVKEVMYNSGQDCGAPTRILVPRHRMDEAIGIAGKIAAGLTVGDPLSDPDLGPVVSQAQFEKVQCLIEAGIAEGATLVTGGLGRPEGLDRGYYVKPTVFANVSNNMRIAREEIFGPVASILSYDNLEDAVAIGNDTDYGLCSYIWGADAKTIDRIAIQLRSGRVKVNDAAGDPMAPYGGYKRSGNGREFGEFGLAEFLEVKAIVRPAVS
ncbi:aldehyde dehydrogenase family protein [Bradyrhizobium sp. CNPSo 4010]|uniref:Aldehyde dehydrogenase family protein n=1 Tax=Bradyrhizobium agreste TaxID=2751811 RepID=A0ABS0PGE7_9BRAD|nr:aldehyde dehydrogenase family protein [Bradyrhizobium agreste]MBH5396267.1 aldehyde dehydrogenase family protein [Bradyrhizobium agreste]